VDKHELEHFMKRIYNYTWNFYTQQSCLKIRKINNTGGETRKGELVHCSPNLDNAVELTPADEHDPIGVFAEDGEKDGELAWIIYNGSAQVMLKDTTLTVHGNIILTSDVLGRADATLAAPPGGGVVQLDQHFQELGHSFETAGAGVDVLIEGILHFN